MEYQQSKMPARKKVEQGAVGDWWVVGNGRFEDGERQEKKILKLYDYEKKQTQYIIKVKNKKNAKRNEKKKKTKPNS